MNRTALSLAALGMLFLGNQSDAAVGRTPGQFAVSPTGSAQYTIPIFAPPGPRGMQPGVSLSYDSRNGNGPLGLGWVLAGFGSITRCNRTFAQDAAAGPVALLQSDGYCLNGNRLRLTSGTYGAAGSVYQTEIADFSQITANGTAGNGPASFTVQGRNGLTYYYGYTDSNGYGVNSQVLAGASTAVTWLLSKVVDRSGNSMAINYIAGTSTSVPGTIYWGNSTAGGSTYNYQMVFTYSTNNAQTSIYGYVAGNSRTNVNLLTDISITYTGSTVKKYILSYHVPSGSATGRNVLYQVQECADSGGTNCLSPTTIGYQTGTLGISSTAHTALSSGARQQLSAKYDFNGDGYRDLVYYNGTDWYVAFGSASGFGTPVNTCISSPNALFGDLQGIGKDEILADNGGNWYYYKANGTGCFTGAALSPNLPYSANGVMLADFDGDGLPDLVSFTVIPAAGGESGIVTISTQLNTSTSSAVSFNGNTGPHYTTTIANLVSAQLILPSQEPGPLRVFDFNGDGLSDLALVTKTTTQATFWQLLNTGTNFSASVLGSAGKGVVVNPVYFNVNDDACTDLVWNGTLYESGCNGEAATNGSIPGGTYVTVANFDGSGRGAVLVPNGSYLGAYLSTGTGLSSTLTTTSIPYSSSCTYFVLDADGDGLDDLGCWNQTTGSVTYYLHYGAGVNPDLATSFTDGYGNSASPTYVALTTASANYVQYNDATYPERHYDGPLYIVTNVAYSDPSKAPGNTYNQQIWYYEAWTNLQGRGFDGFYSVATLDSRNQLVDYRYYDQTFPLRGMSFEDHLYNMPLDQYLTEVIWDNTSTTLSSTQYQQRYFDYASIVTKTAYEVNGTENGDLISTSVTNYTYDNYGNALTIGTTITDNDPGSPYKTDTWTTNTTNTPDVDTTHWCLGLNTETQVAYTATIGSAVTRTQTFTPDTTNCRYTQIVTEPTANSGLYKVTEALTFDSFGNVATDTVTGANMPASPASRETQYNWGTTGQFLNTLTDPSGAVTTWTYTSIQGLTFGVPDSKKDANSLTTSWTYDGFGRKTKETRPDGTSTGWAWTLCTSDCGWSNSVYQIAQTAYQTNGTTVIRTDTSSYDPIDRVTQTAGPTVTGTTATAQKLYNSLGLVTQQSMPFLSGGTAYQQTYAYDVLNRLIESERPVNASSGQTNCNPATVPPISGCQGTAYSYAGRTTTVTDPYSNTKTTVTDVNGWLRQAKDAVGYPVTRAYDSAGSLIGVTDSVGNSLLKNVTVVYGIKPFVTAATDADRGAWTYTVDSLGERTGWTDANGNTFAETYDALSRPSTRTDPVNGTELGQFTQWTYGSTPASDNVGQLISECSATANPAPSSCGASPQYSESRTFDSYGRLQKRSITELGVGGNDGSGQFLYSYGFSATTGLLNSLTYPTSTSGVALNLQYGYGYGLLSSVADTTDLTTTCGSTCTLWSAGTADAYGHITKETLGNGIVVNRSFDGVTSWLTQATAGVGGGAGVLNQSYLQDKNGNVTQRQAVVEGTSLTENLFYDGDNRLVCATLTSGCSTNTFQYDGGVAGPGNITNQVGVGTYTYPAAGQSRPHAVTSITGTFNGITNPSFGYDANGNMTKRASSTQNIYWNSYNYPQSISGTDTTGSEEVQLSYGPDRQRIEQVYTGPSGTETTYYIGNHGRTAPAKLEVVETGGTNYRHYIYAGTEPIAVYSRTSGGTITMNYMLSDHQGGASVVASNSGTETVNESFSAFGQRRNPTTWSGAPSSQDLTTIAGISRQGYTFQTWLGQSMGLNHMNGRVQDAILGSFLSPDPHVPDPTNAQNYNRYAHVLRNPVTLVDPSGFSQAEQFHVADGGDIGPPGISIGTLGQWTYFSWGAPADGDLLSAPQSSSPSDPGTPAPGNTSGAPTAKDGSGSSVNPGALTSNPASSGSPAQSPAQPGAQPDPSQPMLPPICVGPGCSAPSPSLPPFPGISGLMVDQSGPSAPGPSSSGAYRFFSKPDAPSFMATGVLVGAGTGLATAYVAYNYVVATGEMSLDAFAGLPVITTFSGATLGLIGGALAFGVYELSINPPPSPYGPSGPASPPPFP